MYSIIFMQNSPKKRKTTSQCEQYLDLAMACDDDTKVLDFWKTNGETLPSLAKLDSRYLSVPATTGSVEKLFSMEGAIARARSARLTPSTLKALVLYKEYLN